nr:acyl-CoA dehydrogenase family protein [Natronobiforma cellulositropha]
MRNPRRSRRGGCHTTDFPAERFYRDAKLNEIYEGTSEVLRNTIGHRLLE